VKQKEKIIIKKINEEYEKDVKRYDNSIQKNLKAIEEKYYKNINKSQNKTFYDLILEIIYPHFLVSIINKI
jgi:DNA-binding protein Fis